MRGNFEDTYKALFRRYYAGLLFYATRLVGEDDAEDIVQDVFVEIWRRQDSVEFGEQIQASSLQVAAIYQGNQSVET